MSTAIQKVSFADVDAWIAERDNVAAKLIADRKARQSEIDAIDAALTRLGVSTVKSAIVGQFTPNNATIACFGKTAKEAVGLRRSEPRKPMTRFKSGKPTIRGSVIALLKESGRAMTTKTIHNTIRPKPQRHSVYVVLSRLVASGEIVKVGKGRYAISGERRRRTPIVGDVVLGDRILRFFARLPLGETANAQTVFIGIDAPRPKNVAVISTALSELCKKGKIERVMSGIYRLPNKDIK